MLRLSLAPTELSLAQSVMATTSYEILNLYFKVSENVCQDALSVIPINNKNPQMTNSPDSRPFGSWLETVL